MRCVVSVLYIVVLLMHFFQRLTQACELYLKEEKNTSEKGDEKTTVSSSLVATTTAFLPRSILKPTPGPLIDIPSSNEPDQAPDTVVPSPAPKSSVTDIRRTRAQSLLDALRSSNDG